MEPTDGRKDLVPLRSVMSGSGFLAGMYYIPLSGITGPDAQSKRTVYFPPKKNKRSIQSPGILIQAIDLAGLLDWEILLFLLCHLAFHASNDSIYTFLV